MDWKLCKELSRVEQQSRVEQSRAEQSRAEQSRAEQSRAEQSRAEQSRAEQSGVEQSGMEQSEDNCREKSQNNDLTVAITLEQQYHVRADQLTN